MRSSIISLALTGAAGFANAESAPAKKRCSSVFPSSSSVVGSSSATVSETVLFPSATSSSTLSDSDSFTSSLIISSSSSSISITLAGSSSTSTSSPTVTTSPAAVQTVVNDVGNGDFGAYDPNSPGGIANWESQNCEINLNYGYSRDGSSGNGCVQMTAAPTKKRDISKREDYTAMIMQRLQDVDATTEYTIRFYYTILSNTLANTCRMEAYYGDALLTHSDYFDVVTDAVPGNTPWIKLVDEATLSSSDGYIRFQLTCTGGGNAVVFIDEVFVSNKVDATDVDNISLIYTSTGSATTSTSTTSTSTSEVASLVSSASIFESKIDISSTASYSAPIASGSIWTSGSMVLPTSVSELSSSSSSTSMSSSTATSPTAGSLAASPTVCVASATATSGLTCGSKIYSNKAYYKRVQVSDVTRDQCAAACLADSNCQSISYYSTQTCSATCFLQSASVAAMGYTFQFGNGFPQVWDKGCFTQTACSAPAEGSVCVDKMGSAPASTCKSTFMGTAKSCAQPFATATVSAQCGAGACMALCKQYPSCKSFSTNYGGSVTCNFYSGELSEVAESGSGSTIFSDISCYECGSGSSVFNWLTPLADPSSMPDLSACSASSSSSSSSIESSTITTSVAEITSSSLSSTDATTTTPSTTAATTTTASSCVTCTAALLAPAGTTCGVQGEVLYEDAYGVWGASQNSMMDCAAICYKDSSCKAYGYRANSNPSLGCAFIQSSLSQAGFSASSSSNYYWSDKSCASCGNSCASSSSSAIDSMVTSSSTSPSATSSMAITSTVSSSASAACTSCTAANPVPSASGVACAKKGTVANYTPYSFTWAEHPGQNSLMECAAICSQVSGCKAYALDVYYVGCKFLDYSLTDAGFASSDTSTVYWSDMECAACGVGCSSSSDIASPTPFSSYASMSTTLSTSILVGYSQSTGIPTSTSSSIVGYPPSTATSSSASASASSSSLCSAPKAKLEEGVICGLPSSQASSSAIEVLSSPSSLYECASQCLLNANCSSFRFSTLDASCWLYEASMANNGLDYTPSSKNWFYDRECFSCA
ncbi:hypothetical protein JX265_000367 [Neoarthrinium moseri]|uniref:Apple domain-containing protein n=1 Tax=Neoarthrinium moseri TaxID=1658444 RepID=A0A9P9WYN9_9PEZI|nr:hypothetical protein JX265_000367 [Neoarthrinium moseri]